MSCVKATPKAFLKLYQSEFFICKCICRNKIKLKVFYIHFNAFPIPWPLKKVIVFIILPDFLLIFYFFLFLSSKMKIFLPLVLWIVLLFNSVSTIYKNICLRPFEPLQCYGLYKEIKGKISLSLKLLLSPPKQTKNKIWL